MGDDPTVVEVCGDPERARSQLRDLCDRGFVADLMLHDGTSISGVLIGVSSTSLGGGEIQQSPWVSPLCE
jgi:hypothetical protein